MFFVCEFVQISGLTLVADEENLALIYLATIQALAVSST
jgi:ribulose kinase